MFEQFPKQRPELPLAYQEIIRQHHFENREGFTRSSAVTKFMESWMHRQVARDMKGRDSPTPTLEIGAGTLNHLTYEKTTEPYDIVEPDKDLIALVPERRGRIRNVYNDLFEIFGNGIYQRIISIATLEHLLDLPAVIAKAGLLLEEKGVLRVTIPNEGCLLWKIGYRLTNGIEFRLRYSLDYETIMRHEHVNTATEIDEILEYFFGITRWSVLGLTKRLSFYRFYACSHPRAQRCSDFLNQRPRFAKDHLC